MLDQQVTTADLSIQEMTAVGCRQHHHVEITTTIPIHCENDDDAANVRCLVLLPPTTQVLSSTPPAVVGPTFAAVGQGPGFVQSTPCQGYLIFDLPVPMAPFTDLTLVLVTRVHESYAGSPITAVVFSDLPDADAANNIKSIIAT